MEATKLQDCSQVAKLFQKKMLSAPAEDNVIGGLMSCTVMMQVGADSASSNLTNAISPPIPDIIQQLLNAASESSISVELPIDASGILAAGNQMSGLGLEWLEKCVPCSLRLKFRADLALSLNDTLLNTLEDLLGNYLKQLAFIMNMLNASDVYQDACLLLKALNDVCIPDIQRMISLMSAMLYRQTSKEILESTDIMKLLIQPIFEPIFTNITQLFGQYKVLVTDPLQCVIGQLSASLEKIKTGGFLENQNISAIESRTNELEQITGITGTEQLTGVDFNSPAVSGALRSARSAGLSYDDYISNMQNSLGSSVFHLKRIVTSGVVEVESVLAELLSELDKFVGGGQQETLEFLTKQYDKLLIVRMIQFLIATVRALSGGLNCEIPDAEAANSVLTQFFEEFLGPESNVLISVDTTTNNIMLVLDTNVNDILGESNITIDPTGNNEVDQAVDAIITQANTPVRVIPQCFFEAQTPDDNKLAAFLAELDNTEV